MDCLTSAGAIADAEIVARVRAGDHALFEVLMRRHNQRLYRAARAIVRDDGEIEDVMQQTYMNAFVHLAQFESRSQFSTWLTRILINEATHRRRVLARHAATTAAPDGGDGRARDYACGPEHNPERQAYASEVAHALE